jgi:hypothetical protein
MNKRTQIILRVNEQAEDFYADALRLGTLAAQTFLEESHSADRQDEDRQRHRAQLTGLENIAETALKFTDILDYIKKQTARQKGWKEEHHGQRFGIVLKEYIETDIRQRVNTICGQIKIGNETDEERRDRQYIYLLLIRQFIRQLVVQYEYELEKPATQSARESEHAK